MIVKKTSFQTGITPYADYPANALVGQFARAAVLTKIVYAIDSRNAWHWTMVSRYFPRTFSLSFDVARQLVEPMRVQGSSWEIREIPSIAFIGSSMALVVSEINTSSILNDYPFDIGIKPFFSDLAQYFKPVYQDRIVRFIVDCPNEVKQTQAFNDYSSDSLGGNYLLKWHQYPLSDLSYAQVSSWCLNFRDLMASHSFLGIVYSKESKLGLRIIDISQYSPLATAGIKKGDLLVRVTVGTKTESLLSSIPDFVPGTDILFDLERNGAIEKIRFTASSFKDFEMFG